jgi:hypothetical protein
VVVWCGGVVWCGVVVFLTDNNTTPTKVVLRCFGLLVGLWQLDDLVLGYDMNNSFWFWVGLFRVGLLTKMDWF